MKRLFVFLAVATFVAALAGCSVNTKLIERERVDQGVSGNRGYLQGTPPPSVSGGGERKTTRKYYEVQVEFPSVTEESRVPKKATQEKPAPSSGVNYGTSVTEEDTRVTTVEIEEKEEFTNYTVQKSDTLQKISMKFFGTTKKWKRIFDANKDVLRTPDRVRPGMVLKIPRLESIKVRESEYIK
ncbi:MAG: LysM peptidoglycan-binding domain-containing protein [Candidatus Omnitrophota bacterium]|nr:LysM peptidoglycan-binding domain-containing protein [Candidatus Omnitrophota bacterium]